MTRKKQPVRSQEVVKAMGNLLKSCERQLIEQDVVIFDDIRELRRLQTRVSTGEGKAVTRAVKYSLWVPLLDYWRRLAVKELDRAVASGVPKTTKARRRLAMNLRIGLFGSLEHVIRDTVRHLYPIRWHEVPSYTREGKAVKDYNRVYGDPKKWVLPDPLLSDNARLIYRYVLEAPLPKKSNWDSWRF